MKVIVLGASGLIGSYMFNELSKDFETIGTIRKSKKDHENIDLFKSDKIIDNIDILNFDDLIKLLKILKPNVIINCIGVTKRKISENVLDVIKINSIFPHELAKWGSYNYAKIIHFSTDCVFNGLEGNYNEKSITNAFDIYGKTKALGEIQYENSLTIRSSFIGRELFDKTELLEWVISNNGEKIKGFKKTMYSGVSALFLSKWIKDIIINHSKLNGLYQLSSDTPISKYDLLCLIRDCFELNLEIIPENNKSHYPTLDSSKLKNKINFVIPSWEEMLVELKNNKIN
jgi:dTDP-4-dehydrorhamnose reductase